ncbi:MAG: hypothetical protein HC909_01420 [Blastochloris sp.]|nr:hypothetical protein [Blastochloris sp.]
MTPLRTAQAIAALVSGAFVSFSAYTSSQTITIPADATKALTCLWGGGGGAKISQGGGGGGGGGVIKYLTSLTPGNTMSLTIGAGGGNSQSGGASSLTSGSQVISTLTATGGSTGASYAHAPGGNGSGGDINVAGQSGIPTSHDGNNYNYGVGGSNAFGMGRGGGDVFAVTGSAGGCMIFWFK